MGTTANARNSPYLDSGIARNLPLPACAEGPLPLRWVYLHVLREFAQHCGHADILREQILSAG